jgi:hypothetical protein
MDERDFHLLMRAKRQIKRESSLRSFLLAGLIVTAGLRLMGLEMSFLYPLLFVILFVSLILNSDLIANFGLVTKSDLVKLIERHIHSDPEALARYASSKNKA